MGIIYKMKTNQKLTKLFLLSSLITESLDSENSPKFLKVSVSGFISQAFCSLHTALFPWEAFGADLWCTAILGICGVCHWCRLLSDLVSVMFEMQIESFEMKLDLLISFKRLC